MLCVLPYNRSKGQQITQREVSRLVVAVVAAATGGAAAVAGAFLAVASWLFGDGPFGVVVGGERLVGLQVLPTVVVVAVALCRRVVEGGGRPRGGGGEGVGEVALRAGVRCRSVMSTSLRFVSGGDVQPPGQVLVAGGRRRRGRCGCPVGVSRSVDQGVGGFPSSR